MNPWRKAKQDYEAIKVPKDLDAHVNQAIEQGQSKKGFSMNKGWTLILSSFACFLVMMNLSPVFAQTISDLPWIGNFLRIFTFKHIEMEDELTYINADIPALYDTGNNELERQINTEVYQIITDQIEECKIRAVEDWEAYLKTGGDPEMDRKFDFYADYAIKYDCGSILSFVIKIEKASASVQHLNYYYNLNTETGEFLQLKEIAGDDYIEKINQNIMIQIDQREKENEDNLYFEEDLGFSTIDENQNFYINEQGQLVIVFERYEIAPGYMGEQEFVMPFSINLPQ